MKLYHNKKLKTLTIDNFMIQYRESRSTKRNSCKNSAFIKPLRNN